MPSKLIKAHLLIVAEREGFAHYRILHHAKSLRRLTSLTKKIIHDFFATNNSPQLLLSAVRSLRIPPLYFLLFHLSCLQNLLKLIS